MALWARRRNTEMVLGIDPKVDFAFKWLLGREDHTSILINLLHSILQPSPEQQITELQVLNPFTDKIELNEKLSILDIRARDALGRQFNVEMQMLANASLRQRILYYWAKVYTGQLTAGANYARLRPTISVCFVAEVMFPSVEEHHLEFRLTERALGISLTEDLAIHFFELPKFRLTVEELATPLDTWLYFLRNAENLDPEALPEQMNTAEIRQAMEALEMIAQVDLNKEIYEGRLKAVRDERSRLEDALSAGEERGVSKGLLMGRIQILQELLTQPSTPRAGLEAMPLADLESLAVRLRREVMLGQATG
jgi:predicted transposase/invertase (TIGR01784 family)